MKFQKINYFAEDFAAAALANGSNEVIRTDRMMIS